jgi:NitT/TauT family transport system substrate-binding protein
MTTAGGTTLKVGVIPVVGLAGYFTAVDQGFFEDHGLRVEATKIAGGSALIPALEANSLDIGATNPVSPLQAVDQGMDVQCIGEATRKTSDGAGLPLVVAPKNEKSISGAKDLEGRTVAVNTLANMHQLVAQSWIKKNGGDTDAVKFVAMDFPDMIPALLEGRVDAAMLDEPFATSAIEKGIPVLDPRPYEAIDAEPIVGCWIVTTKWLNDHKEQAQAFMEAMADAEAYLEGKPEEFRRILTKHTSIDPSLVGKITLPKVISRGTEADYKAWMDKAAEFGLIGGPVDLGSMLSGR